MMPQVQVPAKLVAEIQAFLLGFAAGIGQKDWMLQRAEDLYEGLSGRGPLAFTDEGGGA